MSFLTQSVLVVCLCVAVVVAVLVVLRVEYNTKQCGVGGSRYCCREREGGKAQTNKLVLFSSLHKISVFDST